MKTVSVNHFCPPQLSFFVIVPASEKPEPEEPQFVAPVAPRCFVRERGRREKINFIEQHVNSTLHYLHRMEPELKPNQL